MNPDGSEQMPLMTDAAPDVDPAWSPDRTRIAFSRADHVWVMNADGSNQQQLTSGAGEDHPAWSPDGTKIAFSGVLPGPEFARAIVVMNADGTNPTALTTGERIDLGPDWSPDGTRIAFYSVPVGDVSELWVMNADGTGRVEIGNPARVDFEPSWSPDGTRIAISSGVWGTLGVHDRTVEVMDPDGSDRTTVAQGGGNPAWSPDGSQIVYGTIVDNLCADIVRIPAGGGQPTPLTTAAGCDSAPAWR
jgi:Tol biopolymer transport system component